ncbi:SDR family oxidoreductase [Solimonas sp. K1W22B-7]|uniref:SDR family oxidoreductase n=1 Tax=Solimonas sp. K1W22B-7 TaxID=2303331 RepID=UPI000E335D62|nr:SDR family oxidoreductase [Solimonas sp. K1W22B-7]AXQ31079.1 SDR family oxidoreductase [Solimonas sp. K1W22B-7]
MNSSTSLFSASALSGRVAFVAGGSRGINRAIARRYAAHGAAVFVVSRDQSKIDDTVAELRALGAKAEGAAADVRDFAAVEAAINQCADSLGPIDIVVSGAAGNFVAPAHTLSSNGFRTVVDIDLNGTFHVFRAAYPRLRKPGASLLAISATHALLPAEGQAHVCSAKAGIQMLTQVLALEWGKDGVRVNSLAPGPVDGTEGMARLTPDEASRAALYERIPLGRYASLDEIADLALFLSTSAAGYITGTTVVCDGGQSLTGHARYGLQPA